MSIKIVSESNERMIIRVGLFYVIVDHLIVSLPILLSIVIFVVALVDKSFHALLIIPILLLWSILAAFLLGRSLNSITIDKSIGSISMTRIGPWLPGKTTAYKIDSIAALDFIYTEHSIPFSNYLIFLFHEENNEQKSKVKLRSYKIMLHERWWWLLSEENVFEKHMRIAGFLGVQYRRRLLTKSGWKDKIENA